jgi:hypothetical protein
MRQSGVLSIIPRINLIKNIGFGAEATHTKFESFDLQVPSGNYLMPIRISPEVATEPKLERRLWLLRRMRWLTFPLFNPLKFIGLVFRYLSRPRKQYS